jgi:hypothetical protein
MQIVMENISMPAVKIIAEWSKQGHGSQPTSKLEFVAAITADGHIKPDLGVCGVITGYDYGSFPPGDYSFNSKKSDDQKYLRMDWGRDYQQFNSTIDVLGRRLQECEIITHMESRDQKTHTITR